MERKAAQRYFSQVRRDLVCGREDRRRLLTRCMVMMDDFQQENPGVGYEGLVAAFGNPGTFAAEMLSSLESAKVETARKRRRFVRFGAFVIIFTALIATSVFWYVKFVKTRDLNENVIIVKGPIQELTDEEFREIWENAPEEGKSYG